MPKVGAHISAAGSLDLSIGRALNIKAECMQIFVSPPQQWLQTKHSLESIESFKRLTKEREVGPNFIHGTYLINLATDKPENLQKSIDWLIYALNLAGELGVEGVIFHTGSHGKRGFETVKDQIASAIKQILNSTSSSSSYLILENSAGQGGTVGGKFSELGQIVKALASHSSSGNVNRVKVCLDTCHAYAAGYDLKNLVTLKDVLQEFDEEIGLENLAAIHANDCKFELGSGKDRHENIGEGFIGKEGFENLVNHPKLSEIPFILEVPGFSGNGPDEENIDILKNLVHH